MQLHVGLPGQGRVVFKNSKTTKFFAGFYIGVFVLSMTIQPLVFDAGANHISGPYGNEEQTKVKICHWNSSDGGSYNGVEPNVNSILNVSQGNHGNHGEDIIPPFHYKNGNSTATFPGRNWFSWDNAPAGYESLNSQDIWNNGVCNGDGIVNTPTPSPLLTVTKVVTNDDGGTATVSDFSLYVGLTQVLSGIQNAFIAGIYAISELGLPGYNATFGGDCVGGSITLSAGDVKSCTITNNDIAPTLKLVKQVINDNEGSSNAGSWELSALGDGGFTDYGDSTTFHPVLAGETYTLSESGPSGYTASSWSCDGGDLVGNQIILSLDEDVTCTITNNDDVPPLPEQASLTLVKLVVNDDGGQAVSDDWTLTAEGDQDSPTVISGISGSSSVTNAVVELGTYTLSESAGPSGYFAGDWSCVVNTNSPATSNTVTLNDGDSATCTIINDDQPATLVVKKVVVNNDNGTSEADDFSFEVNGGSPVSFEPDGQNDLTVDAGTYTVTEVDADGYSMSYDNCEEIVLVNGGSAICTITNDDDGQSDPITYPLIADTAGSGSGTVTSDIAGINCEGDCSENYDDTTVVTLNASADPGSTFTGWSGDCSGTGSCVVTMSQARSVIATFDLSQSQPTTYTLTVTTNGDGHGSVKDSATDELLINCDTDTEEDDCGQTYPTGTVLDLFALPREGSNFDNSWSLVVGSGSWTTCSGNTTPCQVTMNGNITLNAHFGLNQANPTPTPTPPTGCQSNCGGGGGGGPVYTPTPTPTPSPTPSPTLPGEVLGATTVLPETGFSMAERVVMSMFAAFALTGILMIAVGFGLVPVKLEE